MGIIRKLARYIRPDQNVIVQPQPLDLALTRIGGGVTPYQMSSYMRSADSGDMCNLINVANESRQKDCHLQGILATREVALSGLDYSIKAIRKPGEQKPSKEAEDVADFVKEALDKCEGRTLRNGVQTKSFTDCISQLSGASYYGFAVTETDYTVKDHKVVPAGFHLINHRRFQYSREDGALELCDQYKMTEGVKLQNKYPMKFTQHQPRINGDIPVREGLLRVLLWAALFRNWDIGDWLKLAELSWKPWRKGVYKSGASTEDINNLVNALEGLTSNGVATHSDRVGIDIEWPQRGRGARPEHAVLAEFLGGEMSKAVLGQTLTVESGERGARSLGEVHDRVRKDIMESDARQVSATIRRDIVSPLVKLNFGFEAPVPEFSFNTEDTPDFGAFMRGIDAGARSGLHIPQAWARDKSGVRHPEPGEPIIVGQGGALPEVEGGPTPEKPTKPSGKPEEEPPAAEQPDEEE